MRQATQRVSPSGAGYEVGGTPSHALQTTPQAISAFPRVSVLLPHQLPLGLQLCPAAAFIGSQGPGLQGNTGQSGRSPCSPLGSAIPSPSSMRGLLRPGPPCPQGLSMSTAPRSVPASPHAGLGSLSRATSDRGGVGKGGKAHSRAEFALWAPPPMLLNE